jgi:hypothetical protein
MFSPACNMPPCKNAELTGGEPDRKDKQTGKGRITLSKARREQRARNQHLLAQGGDESQDGKRDVDNRNALDK